MKSKPTTAVHGAPETAPLDADAASRGWFPNGEQLAISDSRYRWTARLFTMLERLLSVNLKLHGEDQIETGQIFLFNHFARFETFIPQYFIYRESGAYTRSIASSEFFAQDDPFSDYLLSVGAVPNRLPGLLPFLAGEVLKGRKVVVFPEGGIVKDRRVVDDHGRYAVYSRTADERRKHHSGAAVLALGLDLFQQSVLDAQRRGDAVRLTTLADSVEMEVGALLQKCKIPVTVVPSNITFYPIRVGENLLSKGAELISRGVSQRLSEELLIEGNILLENTDMDIRLGDTLHVQSYWRWWERPLLKRVVRRLNTIQDAFDIRPEKGSPAKRALAICMRRETSRIRDEYMHRMYTTVSVNLSHLASALVLALVDAGQRRIRREDFHLLLYRAVKATQKLTDISLHRSLRYPDRYAGLLRDQCEGLAQLMSTALRMELVTDDEGFYVFHEKLRNEHHFDSIRLENLVEVYANEIEPLHQLQRALGRVVSSRDGGNKEALAMQQVDDELIAFSTDFAHYNKPQHAAINAEETKTKCGEPVLLDGEGRHQVGVVLVHGFLASPAELREFAQELHDAGHTVYLVRLRGHGTSPWDLRDRSYEDWFASVQRGIEIVRGLCERVAVVGFSTGGSLALYAASRSPSGGNGKLAGVCAISVPVRFQNPQMRFVPLVHGANRLVRSLNLMEGVKLFAENESENPDINYYHMPMRGLYELRRLVDEMRSHLDQIQCPVLLIQGDKDPVVVPDSIDTLREAMTGARVVAHTVASERHGLVHDNIGRTRALIHDFIKSL
ncbi:MAG: esterase/lipase [Gammaproteobacteria bacterium]|jgi:esterase/lipase